MGGSHLRRSAQAGVGSAGVRQRRCRASLSASARRSLPGHELRPTGPGTVTACTCGTVTVTVTVVIHPVRRRPPCARRRGQSVTGSQRDRSNEIYKGTLCMLAIDADIIF